MSDLRELYQELIVDHGRRPRNFCVCADANHIKEGYNPLCGDKITVYLEEQAGVIKSVSFQGSGCAISVASASLMTEALTGKTIAYAKQLFHCFHDLITGSNNPMDEEKLGKLTVLRGVNEFPARVKCATLAWHTLMGAIENNPKSVSTESGV